MFEIQTNGRRGFLLSAQSASQVVFAGAGFEAFTGMRLLLHLIHQCFFCGCYRARTIKFVRFTLQYCAEILPERKKLYSTVVLREEAYVNGS